MKMLDIPLTKQPLGTRGVFGNTWVWVREMSQRDMELWGLSQPLWVIDNKIYDLRDFVQKHPGGASWLNLTKGQDISVLYKTHHLNPQKADQILQKYYVKEAPKPNPPRFQFNSKNHYSQIRQKILQKYTIEQLQNSDATEIRCYAIIAIWLVLYTLTGILESHLLAAVCGGLFMAFYGIGHIFVHKKDGGNILKHIFLMIGFSAEEQQVIHAISHHPYPNTMLDYQFSGMEPIIRLARCQPTTAWYHRLLAQFFVLFTGPGNALNKLIFGPLSGKEKFSLQHSVIFLEILYLSLFTTNIYIAFRLWSTMLLVYGFFVGKMLLCSHRQPKLWSEGNPQIPDFVQHIISTTTDTNHLKIPKLLSILIYSSFDLHVIHHLFPTIDHDKLQESHQIFMQVCKEKGLYPQVNENMYECNKKMWQLQRKRQKFQIRNFVQEKQIQNSKKIN